jgi:hypothetical protein
MKVYQIEPIATIAPTIGTWKGLSRLSCRWTLNGVHIIFYFGLDPLGNLNKWDTK